MTGVGPATLAPHAFIENLALVLCVGAATALVSQRLRLPVVFGYMLAGLIIGPHVPVPLVADEAMVRALSELGVMFLLFTLGLDFRLSRLVRVAPTAGTIAVLETSVMMLLGYLLARAFGWSQVEGLFAGGAIAISSTSIIVRVFKERRQTGRVTDFVFGVLVVEDLVAILLIALFTALASQGQLSASGAGRTLVELGVFLTAFLMVGMLVVPRLVRFVTRLGRREMLLLTSLGLCAGAAWLAMQFEYSVALGAFLAGSLVAESGEGERVEALVEPVRDLFAAIFFVSVGMQIAPAQIAQHAGAVLVLAAAVIVGKVSAVSLSTFLVGGGARTAVQTGMSMAQIGEFSFILVGIGVASGAVSESLYPVIVAVSALTTLTTPWLVGSADRAAASIDRWLPRPLQTFVALYGSWIENMAERTRTDAERAALQRVLRVLALDAVVLVAISIGAATGVVPTAALLTRHFGVAPLAGQALVSLFAVALALPFVLALARTGAALGRLLARRAFPDPVGGRLDLAAAPRRAMVVTIQVATTLLVATPVLALSQPFLPAPVGLGLLALLVGVLAVSVWRSTADLQGHVRAAAEAVVSAIGRQARAGAPATTAESDDPLARARTLLPGIGEPHPHTVAAGSHADGRTLSQLALRGLSGATVMVIAREGEVVLMPDGHQHLRAGDRIALAGTRDAVATARRILDTGSAEPEPAAAQG